MILNTDLFNKDRKVAVQCQSEYEARVFLDAAIAEYKDEHQNWFYRTEWRAYGKKTTYGFFHGRLRFTGTSTFDELGYQIVDAMSVLLNTKVDEIETDESLSIYSLFDGEASQ